MKKYRRLLFTLLICCLSVSLYAQSNADKEYAQGVQLMKTMTVAKQNEAIKKFSAAKIMYNTAENKKKCNNMIAQCKKNIKKINPNPDPVPVPEPVPYPTPNPTPNPLPNPVPGPVAGSYNFTQMEQDFIQQANDTGYQACVWWYSDNSSIVALMQVSNEYGVYYSATEFEGARQMDYMLTYQGIDDMGNYYFYVNQMNASFVMSADESYIMVGNKRAPRVSAQQCNMIAKKFKR